MSVTFMLNRPTRFPLPANLSDLSDEEAGAAFDRVFALRADLEGEFNVANANAHFIITEILNLPEEAAYGGAISSFELWMRASLYFDASRGVVEPTAERAVHLSEDGVSLGCLVVNCGRTERQVRSYVERLTRLAEIAEEAGCGVAWG